MIEIRKLAAVDMAWLGSRVILAEYAVGIALPLVLGFFSLRAGFYGSSPILWEGVLGFWLVSIGINYIPLFIYAVLIARAGTTRVEGGPEIAHARRYGTQQVIILIPFMVVILALLQESHRSKKS